MRFASLGSGSRGNAMVVEAGASRVLVDCGFGPRNLTKRLARLGLAPGDLDAILVTHEHSDHVVGIGRCAAACGREVFMTHGTFVAAGRAATAGIRVALIDSHTAFAVGDLEIQPFPVPHDAREPVQFVFSDGNRRLGLLTDTGHVTPHVVETFAASDAIVIECNHDADMLARGNYPRSLKHRIAGRFGHLDNLAAAGLLAALDCSRLQHVVAAHLSEHNNTPQLACTALAAVLGCAPEWVGAASQEEGFGWRDLK
ncbi:MAG: MBL fold metallo-hydrolase [Rhodocyclales bacterium GWA2_65_20]|nr:MAG: MBL fold metallo-hydrolase [Rhodocyclales bacterium GWA2_65_20]